MMDNPKDAAITIASNAATAPSRFLTIQFVKKSLIFIVSIFYENNTSSSPSVMRAIPMIVIMIPVILLIHKRVPSLKLFLNLLKPHENMNQYTADPPLRAEESVLP